MPAGTKPPLPADAAESGCSESDDMKHATTGETDELTVVLNARIQAQLGRKLSDYYSQLVNQPIPDSFLDLLKKLERSEKGE